MLHYSKIKKFKLETLPPSQSIVSCKWILNRKHCHDGTISWYKALVGWSWVFEQIQIIDYGKDIFSLVVKIATLRIVITFVATHNLHIHQMDVKITFLNGTLNEKNYIFQFEGFNCSSKSPKEGQ